jgi:hypothetical protein
VAAVKLTSDGGLDDGRARRRRWRRRGWGMRRAGACAGRGGGGGGGGVAAGVVVAAAAGTFATRFCKQARSSSRSKDAGTRRMQWQGKAVLFSHSQQCSAAVGRLDWNLLIFEFHLLTIFETRAYAARSAGFAAALVSWSGGARCACPR